ncbi:MAG: hypothetical protein GXY58_00560 [Planctomycetaceae bacterium]|nr:hypothetical protein [Planctomycetaceae bacterium]
MRTSDHDAPVSLSAAQRPVPVRPMSAAVARAMSLAIILLAAGAGCRDPEQLETAYGHQRGTAGRSVNGTSVLATLFEEADCQVSTWRRLASDLQQCDVIVWAPDDFGPPGTEVQQYFEQWLRSPTRKTLVYIGRDYNAEPHYWQAVSAGAPAAERIEIMRRLARATAQHEQDRLAMPAEATIEWFTVRRDCPRQQATHLQGPWSAGVDAATTSIHTQGQLQVPTRQELLALRPDSPQTADEVLDYETPYYETLLSAGPTVLVSRIRKPGWGHSQVIVITNGSFLLNLPLVNHAHRKLAGHLIRTCGSGSAVGFLESGPGDPMVSDQAPLPAWSRATRERVLLAAHWCVLGLVYCFCVYPIFGRPRTVADETVPDAHPAAFVQHVDALGELLQRTGDAQFAQRQVEHYHLVTRRDPVTRPRHAGPSAGLPFEPPTSPELDART